MSQVDEERWFEQMIEKPLDVHPLAIEARTGKSWKLIGTIGFNQIDSHNRSAEIGIMIGEKDFWNKGYGSDAMRVMITHGFDDIGLNRVYLHVFECNPRGIRCYEKIGFVKEGTQRQSFLEEWKSSMIIS